MTLSEALKKESRSSSIARNKEMVCLRFVVLGVTTNAVH